MLSLKACLWCYGGTLGSIELGACRSGNTPRMLYLQVSEQHPNYIFFREGLAYFRKTMPKHILQILQQHSFVVEDTELNSADFTPIERMIRQTYSISISFYSS